MVGYCMTKRFTMQCLCIQQNIFSPKDQHGCVNFKIQKFLFLQVLVGLPESVQV